MLELVAEQKREKVNKIALITLSAIFLLMSFLFTMPTWVYLVFGLCILLIMFLYSHKNIKKDDLLVSLIYLIPVISIGALYMISYFTQLYYSDVDRYLLPVSFTIFAVSGLMLSKSSKELIKYIFIGILFGLCCISFMNMLITVIRYGAFYSYRFANYYSYYDGSASMEMVQGTAFALTGFTINLVPINYYIVFPLLLLASIPYYLLNDRKNLFNIIFVSICLLVSIISIIFVINKICLLAVVFALFVVLVISLFITFSKLRNKYVKYCGFILLGIASVIIILFLLNSQASLTGLRSFISSNRLINYVFNTNRYSNACRVLLDDMFSLEKLFGFPLYYFDYGFEQAALPSGNIVINQLMYGGLIVLVFFLVLIGITTYCSIMIVKKNEENKFVKYMPILFLVIYFAIALISDMNFYDEYNPYHIISTPFNPLFSLFIFFGGYIFGRANYE